MTENNIDIPHVCYNPALGPIESCDTCIVRANGKFVRSCSTKIEDNMDISYESEDVHSRQLEAVNRLLTRHDLQCTVCENNNGDCALHNAVDKSICKFLLNGIGRKEDTIMQVSGRAGFEIVQKVAMFGVSVISSVSAPSSLAIELAETFNITLISFTRNNRFNIYTKPERINV